MAQEKAYSQLRAGLQKLKRHRLAMGALWVLFALYFSAIFAGFLAPYHYDNEDRSLSYAPPTKIHFFDENNRLTRPYVYRTEFSFDEFYNRIYVEDTEQKYFVRFFTRGDKHKLLGVLSADIHLFGAEGGRIYLLGADSRGRDLFSRILYGGQISLSIGLIGIFISLLIGLIVGGIAGYFGGKTDTFIMRICEIIIVFPSFFLMLALRSIFSYALNSVQMYFVIVCIMSIIGWPSLARVIRGMALSLRQREFVLAARALGVSDIKIIWRHIIPHTFSYVIVSSSLAVPGYILGESALSMLGLGIQDPYASWGNLLSEAMAISQIKFHPWVLIPGVFIFITVMAFNLLGDGARDVFDPKMEIGRKY